MKKVQELEVAVWPLQNNVIIKNQKVSFRQFGKEMGTAPVILINHALQSNSDCMQHWEGLIGKNKAIDLDFFTVLCFDVPGNDLQHIKYYQNKGIGARDIAVLFWLSLFELNVDELFAVIGADLGGGIAWEMATLFPKRIQNLIPIAASPIVNDWLVKNPAVENTWLNELFLSVDITLNRKKLSELTQLIKSNLHIIHVKDVSYFDAKKEKSFYQQLQLLKKNVQFYELDTLSDNQLIIDENQIDLIVNNILTTELLKVA